MGSKESAGVLGVLYRKATPDTCDGEGKGPSEIGLWRPRGVDALFQAWILYVLSCSGSENMPGL